jgi:hypothetical protein
VCSTRESLTFCQSHFYQRSQQGSWSSKAAHTVTFPVDPALNLYALEGRYDGNMAQSVNVKKINPDTCPERRTAVEKHLHMYWGLDSYKTVTLSYQFTRRAIKD